MTTEKQTVTKFYTNCLTVQEGATPTDALNNLLADSFQSINAKERKDKNMLIGQISMFWKVMPDMKWEIQEMIQEGNKVVVRSLFSASPVGPFMGVETDGTKQFRTMAIDIHTVIDGKITEVYHCEEWLTAIAQLKA